MRNPAEGVGSAAKTIRCISVTEDELTVEMRDGRRISAPLTRYARLLHGTPEERDNWRLIASGHGVHWPDLDEDISARNILLGEPAGESQQSLRRWIDRRASCAKRQKFEEALSQLPDVAPEEHDRP